jgi:hypothetical protein
MKGDGVDSFRRWKKSHENANAILNTASASDILGLDGYSVEAEAARVAALLAQPDMAGVASGYAGATNENSSDRVVEAHFQYLALRFMHFARQAFPHLIEIKRPIYAGLLKSRKRTPFMKPDAGAGAFIGIPVGFLVAADLYFKAHFRLRDLGKSLTKPEAKRCVETDVVGGQAIEGALRFDEARSQAVILQLESGYIAFELFDPAISDQVNITDTIDWLESNLLLETAKVHHELTGRGGEFSLLVATAESRAATYLCMVFGLFHEIGHELLVGRELEFARAVGIEDLDTANAIEAGIDLLAYAGYAAYVNTASSDAALEPLVRAVSHPARFTVGASAFFSVAKAMLFAEQIFRSMQNKADEDDSVDPARRIPPVGLLQKRQQALLGYMKRYYLTGDEGKIDQWHILALGAALEARCTEAALAVMRDRFSGTRSTFCGKYR